MEVLWEAARGQCSPLGVEDIVGDVGDGGSAQGGLRVDVTRTVERSIQRVPHVRLEAGKSCVADAVLL